MREATLEGVGEAHAPARDGRPASRRWYLAVGAHTRARVRLRPEDVVYDAPPPGVSPTGAAPPGVVPSTAWVASATGRPSST